MNKRDVSPPGFAGTVEAMKSHPEIDNPFALAWSEYSKGDQSHKDAAPLDEDAYDSAAPIESTGHTGMIGTYGQRRGSEPGTTPALEAARDNIPFADDVNTDTLDISLGHADASKVRDMLECDAAPKEECKDALPAHAEDAADDFDGDGDSGAAKEHGDAGMEPPAGDKATQIQQEQAAKQEEVNGDEFDEEPAPTPSDAVTAHAVGTIGAA